MKTLSLGHWLLTVCLLLVVAISTDAFGEYNADKVLLTEVKAVTLHQGRMTNARRSPPVPQLMCVGGNAQHKFQPKVVQCINQGSDGYDVQWECKTDMDNSYRFGQVQVSCEGYDYPNDPYVLRGSCGLEYTIEFTEEGLAKERQSNSYSSQNQHHNPNPSHKHDKDGSGLFWFIVILVGIFVIYKKFIAPQQQHHGPRPAPQQGTTQPPPPPPGFRPEFMPPPQGPPPSYENSQKSSGAYAHASAPPPPPHEESHTHTQANSGPGFMSGAGVGGVLGYMMRAAQENSTRNRGSTEQHHHHHHHQDTSRTNSWFNNSSPPKESTPTPSSSGTRTASGFGGTSRR